MVGISHAQHQGQSREGEEAVGSHVPVVVRLGLTRRRVRGSVRVGASLPPTTTGITAQTLPSGGCVGVLGSHASRLDLCAPCNSETIDGPSPDSVAFPYYPHGPLNVRIAHLTMNLPLLRISAGRQRYQRDLRKSSRSNPLSSYWRME